MVNKKADELEAQVNQSGQSSTSQSAAGNPNNQNDPNSNIPKQPEYRQPKANISGKEGAKDIPSWAKGERPYKGENGDRFAKRLLNEKYGKGNYSTKSQTEYSELKKFADRNFEK